MKSDINIVVGEGPDIKEQARSGVGKSLFLLNGTDIESKDKLASVLGSKTIGESRRRDSGHGCLGGMAAKEELDDGVAQLRQQRKSMAALRGWRRSGREATVGDDSLRADTCTLDRGNKHKKMKQKQGQKQQRRGDEARNSRSRGQLHARPKRYSRRRERLDHRGRVSIMRRAAAPSAMLSENEDGLLQASRAVEAVHVWPLRKELVVAEQWKAIMYLISA